MNNLHHHQPPRPRRDWRLILWGLACVVLAILVAAAIAYAGKGGGE